MKGTEEREEGRPLDTPLERKFLDKAL